MAIQSECEKCFETYVLIFTYIFSQVHWLTPRCFNVAAELYWKKKRVRRGVLVNLARFLRFFSLEIIFPFLAPDDITYFGIGITQNLMDPTDDFLATVMTWAQSQERHILSTSTADVEFEALAMQQREALNISFSFWESETCQGTFDLQHLAHCISSNSGWQ